MKLRDLFGDDAAIDPRAEAAVGDGPRHGQPRGQAGRSCSLRSPAAKPTARASSIRPLPPARSRSRATIRRRATGRCLSSPRRIRAARWRWPRRDFIRGSPRRSRPSPAPAARPRSPRSRGRSGSALGHAVGQHRHHRAGVAEAHHLRIADDAGSDRAASRSSTKSRSDGVSHLALEASSHGLDQYRLDGVRIAAGGFTNLSRDHMDYHPDVAHYLAAKLRLFRDLVAAGRRGGDLGRS